MLKKLIFSLTVLISAAGYATAQYGVVQPDHEHKVYVDKANARIFVWKTGLYLFLGTENDDRAIKYQLINADSAGQETVAPFELDSEGLNTIIEPNPKNRRIAKDKLSEFRIYADWSSPKTTVNANISKMIKIEKREIRNEPFDLSLSSTDNVKKRKLGSGTDEIYNSLNDREYAEHSSPVSIVDEGLYTYRFYAVDKVGNVEKSNTKLYALDMTPPTTVHKVLSGNVGDILSPRAVLNLIATDEIAGVKSTHFALDANKNAKYRRSISLKKVPEGEHVLNYYSIDKIDNQEAVVQYPFYLDRTPPVSSVSIDRDEYNGGSTTFVSERSRFTINSRDEKVRVRNTYYNLNKGSEQIFEQSFGLTSSATHHRLSYWADDELLNVSKPTVENYVLDIQPPTVYHDFEGPHFNSRNINYISTGTLVLFKSSDDLSGVQSVNYSLNDGPQSAFYSSFSVDQSGDQTLKYNAIDNVNNESHTKTTNLFVDSGAPRVDVEFGVKNLDGETVKIVNTESGNVFPEKVFLYLYGTDDHSGIKSIHYRINGGVDQIYSGALLFDTPGSFSIEVTVIDNVSNRSSANVDFQITAQ